MDEDEGKELVHDEVSMQDIIDHWAQTYAEGVEIGAWYYDCRTATVIIRLFIEDNEPDAIYITRDGIHKAAPEM